MEALRKVDHFQLIYEPLMKMFRIWNVETEDLSMWFDAATAEELKAMDEDEFIQTAKQYIEDASYAD